MERGELTSNWLNLSVEGRFERTDPFMRFISAWLAFNSLYDDLFSATQGDWRQIQAFASDPRALKSHSRLLKVLPAYSAAIDVLNSREVRNPRTGQQKRIETSGELLIVLQCAYQVRCNLIHGGKHPEDDRDRDLAKAGFIVIANLVSMYLRGNAVGGW